MTFRFSQALMAALMGFGLMAQADAQTGIQPLEPPMRLPAIPDQTGGILALWTQFVPGSDLSAANDAIEVRFVQMGKTDCSGVALDQTPSGNATPKPRTRMYGEFHKNPAFENGTPYEVTICAARLDPATEHVALTNTGGQALTVYPDAAPAEVPGPARLGRADGAGNTISGIALGDSGCRGHDPTHTSGRDNQDCNPVDWPLKSMAVTAAGMAPDFVLHVGDYHYFWELNPYWGMHDGKDRIEFWLQEFLVPAGPLLRTAPWMLARGNHEVCQLDWFGDGWHALFGPTEMTLADTDHCATKVAPVWAVDLAPVNDAGMAYRFVMIDSAQATNADGFKKAARHSVLGKGGASGWVTHYPPIKMVHYGGGWHYTDGNIFDDVQGAYKVPTATSASGASGSQAKTTYAAVSPCEPGKPCIPDAVFVGHQHFYQSFDFGDDLPLVSIVGHGGTGVDGGGTPLSVAGKASRCQADFAAHMPFALNGSPASAGVTTGEYHGFLHLERGGGVKGMDASGWKRTPHWANGRTVDFGASVSCF